MMLNENDVVTDHVLARELGGMTIAEMRARMGMDEYIDHAAFFKVRQLERQKAAAKQQAQARRRPH